MKKLFGVLCLSCLFMFCVSCKQKTKLYVLNWVDYISEDCLSDFEKEYDVKIKYQTCDSNEMMYRKVSNQTVNYDIVFPSDYMIEKMKNEDLLNTIDKTKLTNYTEGMFVDELETLMSNSICSGYSDYYMPYFWGSLGIMYNKSKTGVEEAVKANGYKVFFEQNLLPANTKVGMYGSSRDSFACAELYKGYSLNTKDETKLRECATLLKNTHFDTYGTDNLKTSVSAGNLDVALVYSGDFFDCYYADSELDNTINYDIYCPTTANNVFFDGVVIPKTSQNYDLALAFVDFLLSYDASYANADAVGYAPTNEAVYKYILGSSDWNYVTKLDAYHPGKIVNAASDKAEVYQDLGSDTYNLLESLYDEVIF